MADNTKIEWTDATWNPITGCSVVSPGCTNCYAMKLAGTRLKNVASRKGLTRDTKAGPVWTGEVRFNEAELLKPLSWKRPRKIFACAHGDLFHPDVPDPWIDQVFAVAALSPQHIVQVLTKRSSRMRAYFEDPTTVRRIIHEAFRIDCEGGAWMSADHEIAGDQILPLPNVWLGVSAEDQARADERIPDLLATPAAIRWLSAEPLLGRINLDHIKVADEVTPGGGGFQAWESALNGKRFDMWSDGDTDGHSRLDWVVAGGESGDAARPMHPDWVRLLRDQCAAAGVPFLFKQWGAWMPEDFAGPPTRSRALTFFLRGEVGEALQQPANMLLVGKKAAGRHLDGVLHDAFPEIADAR